jgi:hypothetical protein
MKIEPEDLQPFKDILREVVREELKPYLSGAGTILGTVPVFHW